VSAIACTFARRRSSGRGLAADGCALRPKVAQRLRSVDRSLLCIDTDPVNRAFAGYEALKINALDQRMGQRRACL